MPRHLRADYDTATANGYVSPHEVSRNRSPPSSVRNGPSVEKRPPLLSRPSQAPNQESLSRMISAARNVHHGKIISIRDRICCYQWTWFTMNMATGGVSNVLHSIWTSYRSDWLYYVGLVLFLFNLSLFIMNVVFIVMRFSMIPGSFVHSFLDQLESLFIPSVIVSIGLILVNTSEYGIPFAGPWLPVALEYLYFIYIAVSVLASAGMYLILWSTQIFPIHTMTPVWVFPAYPLLLTAPLAGTLISSSAEAGYTGINSIAIAFSAVSIQGTGFLISFMVLAAFIYRLMTQKLPRDMQRPGVFISIGPSGFTVAGIVTLGEYSHHIIPQNFQGGGHAVFIVKILSMLVGLWLWGLSVWFFIVSVGSLWKYLRPENKMHFQMTWWSFVFPNTALITATIALGKALESDGLKIFGCVLSAILFVVWILIFAIMVRCLYRKKLLWPKEIESDSH